MSSVCLPLVDLTNRKTNVSATAGPTQSNQLHAVGGGETKHRRHKQSPAQSAAASAKHFLDLFLEAKAREPPR